MSKLSAQCSELRAMAESVGLAMPQAATLMMGAADTIWELRDDLQRANAENAKLRTALSAVLQCNGITKRDKGCDACPMYDKEKEYVWAGDWCGIRQFIRELGIEVD